MNKEKMRSSYTSTVHRSLPAREKYVVDKKGRSVTIREQVTSSESTTFTPIEKRRVSLGAVLRLSTFVLFFMMVVFSSSVAVFAGYRPDLMYESDELGWMPGQEMLTFQDFVDYADAVGVSILSFDDIDPMNYVPEGYDQSLESLFYGKTDDESWLDFVVYNDGDVLSLTNLITNGDFDGGYTNWTLCCGASYSENQLYSNVVGNHPYGLQTFTSISIGHNIYVSGDAKIISMSTSQIPLFDLRNATQITYHPNQTLTADSLYHTYSALITNNLYTVDRLYFGSANKNINIEWFLDNALIFDLGSSTTYTKSQLDSNIAYYGYFSGSRSLPDVTDSYVQDLLIDYLAFKVLYESAVAYQFYGDDRDIWLSEEYPYVPDIDCPLYFALSLDDLYSRYHTTGSFDFVNYYMTGYFDGDDVSPYDDIGDAVVSGVVYSADVIDIISGYISDVFGDSNDMRYCEDLNSDGTCSWIERFLYNLANMNIYD